MSNKSEVILIYENIQITKSDLDCLRAYKYVNDKIINFYLKYIYRTMLTPDQQHKVHIFDSFFSEALDQMDEARTIRWLRRVNIFEKEYLLVPVNIDQHWFLMVICDPMYVGNYSHGMRKRPRILTLDSMPSHVQNKKPQMLEYLRNFIRCACIVQGNMTEEHIGNLSVRMQNIEVEVEEQVIYNYLHTFEIVLDLFFLIYLKKKKKSCIIAVVALKTLKKIVDIFFANGINFLSCFK